MIRYIAEDFKRAFLSYNTLLSILILFFSIIIGSIDNILNENFPYGSGYLFFISYNVGIAFLITPILVCFPYVDSYVNDLNSGYIKYLFLKITPVKYSAIRIITNALVSGFTIFTGLCAGYLALLKLKGIADDGKYIIINNELVSLYNNSQIKYVFLLIGLAVLGAMAFSTFSLGLSTIFKNRYLAILFPFFCFIFSGMFLGQISHYMNLEILFNVSFYSDIKIIKLIIVDMLLFFTGIILFLYMVLRKGKNIGYE
nr:hypothetical protein [Sedimentibacter sp.]